MHSNPLEFGLGYYFTAGEGRQLPEETKKAVSGVFGYCLWILNRSGYQQPHLLLWSVLQAHPLSAPALKSIPQSSLKPYI